MDADEREIVEYLRTYGEEWVSSKEICRRAGGKRRFNEDNQWAIPVLQRLRERQTIEVDMLGRYRIKPPPKQGHGRWVSPEIEKILKDGGVQAEIEDTGADVD
jgi:hypothetical protein